MGTVESRLDSLGFELPVPPSPVASYVSTVRSGNLVFVSGHGPMRDGQFTDIGKLGRDLDVDAGYRAARLVMLNCLASIKAEVGDLDKITRIVRLFGMVNSAPGFDQQPAVINGASELLIEVFGDRGKHSRSAVGMAELPFGSR